MLNRESVPQQVAEKLGAGETVQVVSPASLDIMGQIPVQGFAALTNGYIVFLQESGLSGLQMTPYPRNQLTFKGIVFGIIGKTYVFDSGGSEIKFGGLEMPFETALGNAYPQAVQESEPPPPPPPSLTPSQLRTSAARTPPIPPPTPSQIRTSAARTPPPPPMASQQTSQRYPPPDETPYQVAPTPSRGPILAVAIMMAIIFALGIVGFLFMSSTKTSEMKEKKARTEQAAKIIEEENTAAAATPSTPGKSERITVTVGGGTELIGIRKKESGKYKVAIGGQPFKGKVEQDRIKISTESGPTVIKVKVKDNGFKVTDGQDKLIAKIKPDGSGFKISSETAVLARVKSKGNGFIVTGDGTTKLGSAEPDGDGWKVLDESGTKLYSVKGSSGKAAAMLIALKDNVLAQAGVLVYLNEF